MYKQSPSRNHRSKGIKVKHILQICVLLAVCFWLIYQVKHSHEKRKEFESKDEKVVGKLLSDNEIQRFGRKDIPRITEVAKDVEKHEEEDDNDDDKDNEEEDNKHEEDESEKEDARVAEREEERGGGDDEIDEHEPEKTEEEEVDEDKEREEKEENHTENEDGEDTHEEGHPEEEEEESGKEGHTETEENEDNVDKDHNDQDHDAERNTREAQEELYKADDASSEVAHNVQSINQETENVTTGHTNEIYGKINFGQEHETKSSDNGDELIKEVEPKEDVKNAAASNATIAEQKKISEVNLTKSDDDGSLQNSTLPEMTSNTTTTVVGGELSKTLLFNGTQANGTVEERNSTDDKNDQQVAGEDAQKAENNVNGNTTLASSHAANDNDGLEAAKDKNGGDDESRGEKQKDSGSQSIEGTEAIQHDPIDASDTAMEERQSRTDLDTLPEIRSEVHDTEAAVAE